MNCTICNSSKIEIVDNRTNSVTSDSNLIMKPVTTCICIKCGNIFNLSGSRNSIENFYSEAYNLMGNSFDAETEIFVNSTNFSLSDWRLTHIIENIPLVAKGRILDIGCGKGNFLKSFSSKKPDWEFFGIETSKSALEFAKKNISNAKLQEGIFSKEKFKENFDFIVALNVLEHIELPGNFLLEIHEKLMDNGYACFDIPNFKLNPADLFVYDHLTHFTKETLENLLLSCGFKIIKILEYDDKVPILVLCQKNDSKSIKNHYELSKKIVNSHIKFCNEMLEVYETVNKKFNKYGVIGLGIFVWAGLQEHCLDKSKISVFFDENKSLIGKSISNIKINNLTEISKYSNLPTVFSVSPCYIKNILTKIPNQKNLFLPKNYSYYKEFFI